MPHPLLRHPATVALGAAAALLALWLWCRPALRSGPEVEDLEARERELVGAVETIEARRRFVEGLTEALAAGRLPLREAARRMDEYQGRESAVAGILSGRALMAKGFPAPTPEESCALFLLAWVRTAASNDPAGPAAGLARRMEAELAETYHAAGPDALRPRG